MVCASWRRSAGHASSNPRGTLHPATRRTAGLKASPCGSTRDPSLPLAAPGASASRPRGRLRWRRLILALDARKAFRNFGGNRLDAQARGELLGGGQVPLA